MPSFPQRFWIYASEKRPAGWSMVQRTGQGGPGGLRVIGPREGATVDAAAAGVGIVGIVLLWNGLGV